MQRQPLVAPSAGLRAGGVILTRRGAGVLSPPSGVARLDIVTLPDLQRLRLDLDERHTTYDPVSWSTTSGTALQ